MASHTNPICAKCAKSYEQLNGRFCTLLNRRVEYDKEPPCKTDNKKK